MKVSGRVSRSFAPIRLRARHCLPWVWALSLCVSAHTATSSGPNEGATASDVSGTVAPWRVEVPRSGLAILPFTVQAYDDAVYCTVLGGPPGFTCGLLALSPTTGERKWMRPLAATGEPSLVARTGKYVGVIVDAEASVQGLDRDSGHVAWMLILRREFRLQNCSRRIAADQDLFFVAATNNYDRVLALDAATGLAVWSRAVGTELLESAVLVGERLVVANVKGQVYGVDARSGEMVWTTLVSNGPGELAAAGPYVLWHGAADVACLDASDGRAVWTKPLAEPAPLLASDADAGRLYVRCAEPSQVAAFALAGGQEIWSFPTHEEIGSPIVVFGDKVIFLEGRLHVRRLWVLDAKSGQPLASFDLTGKDVRFTARNVDANRYGVYIPVQEVQGEQTCAYIQFLPWDQLFPQVSPE